MIVDDFEQEYSKLEHIALRKKGRNMGAILVSEDVVKFLYMLNRDLERDRCLIPTLSMGELALCVEKADAYSVFLETRETIEELGYSDRINIIQADFLDIDLVGKYSSIILFPPMRLGDKKGRSEVVAYIEKSLKLLAENGSAIILVPQNVLTEPAFREMRETIINEYSLEAVFTLNRVSRSTGVQCSVMIVQNKAQNEKIFMSLAEENLGNMYEGYKNGQIGFYVLAKEVYDRFDANYYDPAYKEVRDLIQRRDTVKLGDIADIINGCMIPSEERKSYGDYLVIKPQYIHDGKIDIQEDQKVFCSAEFASSNRSVKTV